MELSPTLVSEVIKPNEDATMVDLLSATETVKVPASSVVVLKLVSFTLIIAPEIPNPDLLTTFPLTFLCCALTLKLPNRNAIRRVKRERDLI